MEINTQLTKKSAQLGNDITAIQGAGGNTSIKSGDALFIKASGMWLRDATTKSIFVEVSRRAALDLLKEGNDSFAGLIAGRLRPSVETPLHALMPHAVVVHAHCVHTIARSVMPNAQKELHQRLSGIRWQLLPYARPGLPLAYTVRDALATSPADVLILQNHGIVVGGDSVGDAFARLDEVRRRLAVPPRSAGTADTNALECRNDRGWTIPHDPAWHGLATVAENFAAACAGPFYPDHVVFLGGITPVMRDGESLSRALERFRNAAGAEPVYMLCEGKGMLVSPQLTPGAAAMIDALALVAPRLSLSRPLSALNGDDIAALLNWDAEKYRQALAKAGE